MSTLPSQRHLFDIPEGISYFNCAANAPQLNASGDRLREAAGQKGRPWERRARDFFEDAEAVRHLAAGALGGDAEGWAIVPSASYGISSAARILEPSLAPGDRILVMEEAFPSQVLPWRRAAKARGAELLTVPCPPDGDWTRALQGALESPGAPVKVASLSPCHWTDGARLDLEALGAACRRRGTVLVLDATQSLGAMPLGVGAADFLVASGYKWLLCPYGFGLFHVAPAWRRSRPLEETWLAREGAEDFAGLVRSSEAYRPGARRFDVGETCTTLLPGALAALEQLGAWGVPRVARTLEAINRRIEVRLSALGFRFPAFRSPHLMGAVLPPRLHDKPVLEALRGAGIHVSQRGRSLRIAPHLHVTEEDEDRLCGALEALAG